MNKTVTIPVIASAKKKADIIMIAMIDYFYIMRTNNL